MWIPALQAQRPEADAARAELVVHAHRRLDPLAPGQGVMWVGVGVGVRVRVGVRVMSPVRVKVRVSVRSRVRSRGRIRAWSGRTA